MSAVRVIWKCTQPASQILIKFYEQLMTQAAQSKGMDTTTREPRTTHIGGKYVKTVPHITGDVVNVKKNVGYALHYNLDPTGTAVVPGTSSAPNPNFRELRYKKKKRFVLIEEIVHGID